MVGVVLIGLEALVDDDTVFYLTPMISFLGQNPALITEESRLALRRLM